MSKINWKEQFGWTDEQLSEIRNIGYAYIRQGKYDTAIPFFEALVVLDKNTPYDVQTLGALYVQTNEPALAIKYLDQALQMESDHSPTLLNLAKAFFMSGQIDKGMRLAKVLKKDQNAYIAGMAAALMLTYIK